MRPLSCELQLSYELDLSVSVIGVFGYDEFDTPEDYEGGFQTRSASYKHVKVGYAYSDTCFTINVGATISRKFKISVGATNYTMVQKW